MTRGFRFSSIAFGLYMFAALVLFSSGCGGAGASNNSGTTGISFVKSSNPATNPWPQSVAMGDFNGDGKLDLAVPVYSISKSLTDVNILLGNGDGTFRNGPTFPLIGQNVNNIVVADFNGDGKADIAMSLPDAGQIQVLLGKGDGTFIPMSPITADSVYVIVEGDLNRDGKPDLVAVNVGPGTVTVFLGNGDGTFTAMTPISLPSTGPGGVAVSPVSVVVGDFNGDGIPDLAAANDSRFVTGVPDSVTILLGNGDGTFTLEAESPTIGNNPSYITAGDFNKDGILDLAVANLNVDTGDPGTVTVLLGKGDGTFAPTAASPVTGLLPYSVAVADFDGDGKPDLVTANAGSNSVTVLLGNGDGTFAAPMSVAAGTDPIFVAVGDLTGDGIPDLAVANNSASSLTILLGRR